MWNIYGSCMASFSHNEIVLWVSWGSDSHFKWRHPVIKMVMITSSKGNIFRVTGPFWEEFTGHRWFPLWKPVAQSFDVFFDMRLNKRLSKLSRRQLFETPSRSLRRHCNVTKLLAKPIRKKVANTVLTVLTIIHFLHNEYFQWQCNAPNQELFNPVNA